MTRVVDASVALRWFVRTPRSEDAAALLDGSEALVAPDLVVAEVANAAWKLARAGQISAEKSRRIARAVATSFDRLVPGGVLVDHAAAIAQALDHPVYDCLYLALAAQEGSVVVTTDRRLLQRVRETEHASLVRAL